MKIYDISYVLNSKTPIYPGNPHFSIKKTQKLPGDTSNVSEITFGSHFATHIDSPYHVLENGKSIDEFPADRFMGMCNVLDFTSVLTEITEKDLKKKDITQNIVLFKTRNSIVGFNSFHEDFIYMSDSGANYLVENKIKFVGTDGPSIKKFRHHPDKVHSVLLENDCLIGEGLNLKNVPEGEYFFIGLPLKLEGSDASPSRIILVENLYG
jgi:arylformamidase